MRIRLLAASIALAFASATHAQAPSPSAPAASQNDDTAPTTFVVQFRVKPGKNAQFEKVFIEMQNGVREHEPGNVYYDFFRLADDPQTYVIVERYKDPQSAAAHGKTEHAGKMLAAIRDLLDGQPQAMRLVLVSPKE